MMMYDYIEALIVAHRPTFQIAVGLPICVGLQGGPKKYP